MHGLQDCEGDVEHLCIWACCVLKSHLMAASTQMVRSRKGTERTNTETAVWKSGIFL
jgi:hypothetical protein